MSCKQAKSVNLFSVYLAVLFDSCLSVIIACVEFISHKNRKIQLFISLVKSRVYILAKENSFKKNFLGKIHLSKRGKQ